MPGGPVIVAPPATNGLANTQAAADTQALLDQSIANLGDQESDLIGGHAERTFKLPNPFYLMP